MDNIIFSTFFQRSNDLLHTKKKQNRFQQDQTLERIPRQQDHSLALIFFFGPNFYYVCMEYSHGHACAKIYYIHKI
uniref:Uncharacterized protein n=1 Tax=Salix viminalis TaxID=40686 RepID=A0A6N2MX57_SALVM